MNDELTFDQEDEIREIHETVKYGSEEWEQHVMSQFLPSELYNGEYPTLNGMRRVTINTLGKVISSKPTMITNQLPGAASCIYELVVDSFIGILSIGASADATQENISGIYNIYPTAIAESRAEARAYRKLLMLSTVSAEEVKGNESSFNSVIQSGVIQTDGNFDEKAPMSSQQEKLLKTKTSKLGINLEKLLVYMKINPDNITKQDCINIFNEINKFQSNESIPEEVK